MDTVVICPGLRAANETVPRFPVVPNPDSGLTGVRYSKWWIWLSFSSIAVDPGSRCQSTIYLDSSVRPLLISPKGPVESDSPQMPWRMEPLQ